MEPDPGRFVNVAVQVLPLVANVYDVVDRAIQVIDRSGVSYEVGSMETVMEGPLDTLLEVSKEAHLACFEAGAEQVMTIIKIADHVDGVSMQEKVAKYRIGE